MYRLLRALTLIVSVAMLPMHATAMAAANPECSRMAMSSPSMMSADKSADCASMAHKAKAAVSGADCCSPHLAALPVSLPARAVTTDVPQLATCDTRLAERCLSPPERPPRS